MQGLLFKSKNSGPYIRGMVLERVQASPQFAAPSQPSRTEPKSIEVRKIIQKYLLQFFKLKDCVEAEIKLIILHVIKLLCFPNFVTSLKIVSYFVNIFNKYFGDVTVQSKIRFVPLNGIKKTCVKCSHFSRLSFPKHYFFQHDLRKQKHNYFDDFFDRIRLGNLLGEKQGKNRKKVNKRFKHLFNKFSMKANFFKL